MDEWDEQTSRFSPLLIAIVGTHVLGIDRRTGKRIWEWNGDTPWYRMAIVKDRIFLGGTDRLVCLAHDNGTKLWDVISPLRIDQTFLVDGNEVVVGRSGEIAAFSANDGKLLWHDPLEGYGVGNAALGFRGVGVVHLDR